MVAMIPVGVIAGHLTAAVVTLKMPKLFESVGVIEVTPPLKGDSSTGRMKPRQFSEQEVGKIANAEILGKVVDGLDLPALWEMDRDAALRKLKESVRCELDPDSNRISVKVRCGAKADARDIAMGIVGCYRERVLKPSDPEQVNALADLNRQIDQQNERTSRSRNNSQRGKAVFGHLETLHGNSDFETNVKRLEELEKEREDLAKSIVPHLPSVTVHQVPQIPHGVASPDIGRNLTTGQGVGLLVTPLLAWPVMLVMNRRRQENITSPLPSPKPEKTVPTEDEW